MLDSKSKEHQLNGSLVQTIFEQSPLGMALVESETNKIYQANTKFVEIIGRSVEELNSIDWGIIIHSEDWEKDIKDWELLINEENDSYRVFLLVGTLR